MRPVKIKTVLLGASGVGKSSLLQRYIHDSFSVAHIPTLGCAYGERRTMVDSKDSKSVVLSIWDTAGQERFQSLTRNFYCRNAWAAVICFSLDDEVRNFQENSINL